MFVRIDMYYTIYFIKNKLVFNFLKKPFEKTLGYMMEQTDFRNMRSGQLWYSKRGT